MSACFDCPRACGASREEGFRGYCLSPYAPRVMRAAPHYGEEPCVSGTRGSGTVFFTGCALRCVYCQNAELMRPDVGRELSVNELRGLLLRLRDTGVHNINLVTGSHYVRPIAEALTNLDLGIPVCWNSSGYESVETLKRLEGLIQVYMPDFKYSQSAAASRYSNAPDYPKIAEDAILEMYRQTGDYKLDAEGLLTRGVLIRHLILPGQILNSKGVIRRVSAMFSPGEVLFSLMSQYTPMPGVGEKYPELARPITPSEAREVYEYMLRRGIGEGYYQDTDASGGDMIPDWTQGGVL